jgi:hypothetical protein
MRYILDGMDPNHWPDFVWMVVAIGLGAAVSSLGLFAWRAIFRRKPGWFLDSMLLGASGFVLVVAVMIYLFLSGERIPKEWQKLGGYFVLCAAGLTLAWISRQILKRRSGSRRKRMLGSTKGEFTVPRGFNDLLPKEIEDEFYKR